MLDLHLNGVLGIGLYCLVPAALLYTINALFFRVANPQNVPLIREPPGKKSFSLKTRIAYMFDCESLFREAYQNYAKLGKAVVLPGFGLRDEVILPTSSLRWVLAQPESVLSVADAFVEIDQVVYSLGHERYVADPWQGNLVRQELNSVLENICAAMNDELGIAFDARFGTDEENWREIDLLNTVRMVVAQAASRFTVGLPLCKFIVFDPPASSLIPFQAATNNTSRTASTWSTAASSTPESPVEHPKSSDPSLDPS
jgi:hypothetical protein